MDKWPLQIACVLLVLAAAMAAGCADRAHPAQAASAPTPPPPPEVFVDVPVSGSVTDYEDFTGRTVASQTIEIRARVTGYLEKIFFKQLEGQDVEQGAVLFEIDPRPYQAEVNREAANLMQTQTRIKRLEADYERAAKTVASKTISQEQFDQVAGQRNEARAQIEVAKASYELAKLNLTYTKVRAPISGRVSRTQFDQGNLVRADETVLTTIVAMDPMYVYFEIDERTLLKIRRYTGDRFDVTNSGLPVMMGLADEEGFPHNGVINFFDNQLDPSTGTLQVRGVFNNSDRLLSPGLFVRIRLPVGEPYRALLISEQALGTDQGQKFVYVVDADNKAQYRRVQVGKLQQGRRVVLEGLAEGDRVVVSGLQRVRPGSVVNPKPISSPGEGVQVGATGKDAAHGGTN